MQSAMHGFSMYLYTRAALKLSASEMVCLFLAGIMLTLVTVFILYGLCSLHCQHVFSKWLACMVYGSFVKTVPPSSDRIAGASAHLKMKLPRPPSLLSEL